MTWKPDKDGWWEYVSATTPWTIRLQASRPEQGLFVGRRHSHSASGPLLRLLPPDVDAPESDESSALFPPIDEVYVRGSSLISSLPQDHAHPFGLDIRHRILKANEAHFVCETVLSIQTSFLDAHPTVDLVCCQVDGEIHGLVERADPLNPVLAGPADLSMMLPPVATRFIRSAHLGSALIMLPPADRAVATVLPTTSNCTRYRLLAGFMEKGVIRKARFWTCLWGSPPQLAEIDQRYQELLSEPLPLTP